MKISTLEEIVDSALNELRIAGVDNSSVLVSNSTEKKIRFSNNTITISKEIDIIFLSIYASKDGKRIIGSTSNLFGKPLKFFINSLVDSCISLHPSKDYISPPSGPFKYSHNCNLDNKIRDGEIDMVGVVKQAIDSGLKAKAERVSGSLSSHYSNRIIRTSKGIEAHDQSTGININLRAFTDDNASGHGLSCSPTLDDFNGEEAGRIAGEYAKRSLKPKMIKDGIYDLVLTPTVAADIIQNVGLSASAFSVEMNTSFLTKKIGKEIATEDFTLTDYGIVNGGLEGRIFDDEGVPTQKTTIIDNGILENYLHNTTTAKKFKTNTTGNAGMISPKPWNLVVSAGSFTSNELISEVKRGLFITNNWYTRFQNLSSGEYSTVPRDAAFLIEDGEIKEPVAGIRISDSIPRQLLNISGISKDRKWIEWWEVEIPTLSPYILLKNVPITRAIG